MTPRPYDAEQAARIVEFVGVPGAGKSSLCARARAHFSAAGGVAWEAADWRRHWLTDGPSRSSSLFRRAQLKLATLAAERLPLSMAAMALLRSDLRWPMRLLALRLVLVNLEIHRCARRRLPSGHLLLVDEGLLQLAVRLFVSSDGRGFRDPSRYARAIPAPDLIVHLRTPLDVALERARRRPRSLPTRFRHLSSNAAEAAMADAASLIDRLVDRVIESHPSCQRVTLTPDDDARRQVESLLSGLSSRLAALSSFP